MVRKPDVQTYDPVTAHVPGVDEELRNAILDQQARAGDPLAEATPQKEPEKKVVFKMPGLKITR
jgi:hypothetical protein